MKSINLATNNDNINLIEPNVNRDAELGVQWLAGDTGRETLR